MYTTDIQNYDSWWGHFHWSLSVHENSRIAWDNLWTAQGQAGLTETVCVLFAYHSATGQWWERGVTTSCPLQFVHGITWSRTVQGLSQDCSHLAYMQLREETTVALPVPSNSEVWWYKICTPLPEENQELVKYLWFLSVSVFHSLEIRYKWGKRMPLKTYAFTENRSK